MLHIHWLCWYPQHIRWLHALNTRLLKAVRQNMKNRESQRLTFLLRAYFVAKAPAVAQHTPRHQFSRFHERSSVY